MRNASCDFDHPRDRVLHIVDPLDEDVSIALNEYLTAMGHMEHWLLVGWESCKPLRLSPGAQPAGIASLPTGHRARVRAITEAYFAVKPTWVHAHSFNAGAYVRLAPRIPTECIVYSPHCYTFERRDLTRASRILNVTCEYLLAPRTGTVAVCNVREGHLAARLHRTGRIVHVPNVPYGNALGLSQGSSPPAKAPIAVAMGPLGPQRDPAFFQAAVAAAKTDTTWMWIGEGEPRYRRLLEKVGVCVTGQLPRRNVLRLLQKADVYVHTAAWEGSCDTLLQATQVGLPIAARSIPTLQALRLPGLAPHPEDLAATVQRLLKSPADRHVHSESARRAFHSHTRDTQAARLRELYQYNR
ncbi:glycosyltransferase [Streptomyces sp. NPDC007205]|uniref:glycosyltransferase n=1 Tax=Streptomyces sp. NPDC007205 TaxID=3154316 RepID=UPI0033F2A6A3